MDIESVSDWNVEVKRRRAILLNHMLLAAIGGGLVALVSLYFGGMPESMSPSERLVEMAPFLAGWLAALITWAWRGLAYRARALIFVFLAYMVAAVVFGRGGLPGSGRVWLLLLPGLAFVLLGPWSGITAGVVSILTYAFFTLAISQKWVVPRVADDLTGLAPLIAEGGSFLLVAAILTLILWSFQRSRVEALAATGAANRQLQAQTRELEETTARLERQSSQFRTATEVARAGYAILDLEKLLAEVVDRIQEGFSSLGVYHAGLFLLDEEERYATLRAAASEAGRLLLETGYKLELDDRSTVGRCIIHRQPRMVMDVGEDTVQLGAIPMPHTRSEVGLPLRSRGRVLGALSLHSTRKAAFSTADVAILQTMADQVAVAIDNARLFSQTEAALEEVRAVQRRYLTQAWREFLAVRPVTNVDYTQVETHGAVRLYEGAGDGTGEGGGEPRLDSPLLREARREAMAHGRTVIKTEFQIPNSEFEHRDAQVGGGKAQEKGRGAEAVLVAPLKLRGQVIGTLALHQMDLSGLPSSVDEEWVWTEEDVAMVETVAEQVALTIDNLRLMDQTQRRAVRERLTREMIDRMRHATDVKEIVQTVVDDLFDLLGPSRAFVRLGPALSPVEGPAPSSASAPDKGTGCGG